MDEPTVRSSKKLRRTRNRLPADAVVVTVRVDDHRDGTMYASMASPDGQRWKAYAYWPKVERVSPGIPIMWDADGTVWVGPEAVERSRRAEDTSRGLGQAEASN